MFDAEEISMSGEPPLDSLPPEEAINDFQALQGPGLSAITAPGSYLNLDQRGGISPNGKTSYTLDQAVNQITRGGYQWGLVGQSVTVTFAFRSTAPGTMPADTQGFSRFSVDQIRATELALLAWSDVSGIRFSRVGTGETGEGAYSDTATILFGNYSTGRAGASAFAYLPGSTESSAVNGDVWINSTDVSNNNPALLGYGALTLIHEIGHAIGLSHPSPYNASNNNNITYSNSALYFEDSIQYTIMSYFDELETGARYQNKYSSAPLMDDIAAVQKLYGPNMTTRTGDTVYGFSSNADRPWFEATSVNSVMIWAVWDAGGADTFNFSGYTSDQKIDLRQGSFSDVGGLKGNVAIAKGVDIENAIGGSGSDSLVGNTLSNRLEGGNGNDTLWGGIGADTLIGGAGNDRYVITDTSDLLVEDVSGGRDTIDISVTLSGGTYTLGVNVEDANVVSTVAYNLIGNALDNQLYGNTASNRIDGGAGNDVLWDGGGGGDTLVGGSGNDVYFIDTPTSLVVENLGEGTDLVYVRFGSSIGSWALSSAVENATIQAISGGSLTGNSLDNRLEGGSGNDTLQGAAGADTLIGGAGDDRYIVTDASDSIWESALSGFDTVEVAIAISGGAYTLGTNIENAIVTSNVAFNIFGNSLDNVIFGNAASNRLEGGAGNDILWDGGGGGDTLIGGFGDDLYYVDSPATLVLENLIEGWDSVVVRFGYNVGAWTLSSNIENASIEASSGGSLIGNSLDNRLDGGAGNDTLQGGLGADTLSGGAGSDAMYGGSGNDYFYVNSALDGVYENLSEGYDTIRLDISSINYIYYNPLNIEYIDNWSTVAGTIYGNTGDNSIYGSNQNDTLFGLEGNDTLRGYTGNDYVEGGDGNDRLEEPLSLQGGNDTYWAGAGNDTIIEANGFNYLRGEAGDDSLFGGTGFDDMHGNMGNDSLRGGDGEDWVVGGKDNDLLFGDAAFDIVYGNLGNDTVDGGAGNDWVRGGQGDDSVMAGAGDDWLWGDRGNDTISGGVGADLFYSFSGAGIDRITDFSYAEGDRLKLEGSPSRTISQVGADVVVDMGNGDQVILVGVSLASLGSGWII